MGIRHAILDRLTSLLSPAGSKARLLTMIYHRVLPKPDPMRPNEVDADMFQWHMKLLAEHFNVLPLGEACRLLQAGDLPARAACITFDDGYADNADVALPILKSFGLPASFFIAAGFLDGGRMWNDTVIELARQVRGLEWDLSSVGMGLWRLDTVSDRYRTAMGLIYQLRHLDFDKRTASIDVLKKYAECPLPQDFMLTTEGVQRLVSAGMEVGAHTVNHPILTCLDDERAQREIQDSRRDLEEITGRSVTLFAYPNGKPGQDYDERHVAMVKDAGFEAAVSTQWGTARKSSDVFQLPRYTPWHRDPKKFQGALIKNYLR